MLKAVITGVRKAGLTEAPTPFARDDWAVVKILAAPMCTEYKAFIQGSETSFLGHEAAGVVDAVDAGGPVRPGDRVVVMPLTSCGRCPLCRAGDFIHCTQQRDFTATGNREGLATYAQYLLKPAHLLMPIPDDLSEDLAALACCGLGPSFGAMARMHVDAFDTILITGLGPVGLGAVINAKYRGARVLAADLSAWRRDYAQMLGADFVLDPTDISDCLRQLKALAPDGVSCALDCSGAPVAHRLCVDAVRRRGRVAFVGESQQDTLFRISPDFIRKGITVYGCWHYNLAEYAKVIEVVRHSQTAKALISHVFPLSCIQEAFEVAASPEHGKIILHPWDLTHVDPPTGNKERQA